MSRYKLNKAETCRRISNYINAYADDSELKNIQISDLLDTDRSYLFQIKSGFRFPSIELLYNICQLLDLSMEDVLVFEDTYKKDV